MIWFLSAFLSFSTLTAYGQPDFERQWSRSTLASTHLGFRYLNRMSPLVAADLVVQGNAVDSISAYNRKTGHQQWVLTFKDGVEGGATLDENRLYFGSNNGNFYCVDVLSGRILWQFELNSESLTRPTVQGPAVYHVTGNNTLYALNKKTGETIWVKTNSAKSNMTVRGQTQPVYDKGLLYVGFSDGNFAAFNAQNGRQLWSKRIGDDKKFNDVDAKAVLAGDCLLVSSYANALYCLDPNNGTISWRHEEGGYFPVTVDGDRIFYPTVSGEIHLLDVGSGKLLKKVINIKGLPTEVVSFDNYIAYGESQGAIVVRDKSTLSKVADYQTGLGIFAKPTIEPETGHVFVMSNDANLYRLDFTDKVSNAFLWSRKN